MAVRAGRRHAGALRRSGDRRRNARGARAFDDPARRRRRHRHPHRQRAARLRDRQRARASAAPGSSTAASTPRCFPDEAARTRRRARGRRGRRRRRLGRAWSRTVVAGRPSAGLRGGRVDGGFVPAGALGSAAGRSLHVGVGADRARLSEALLVLFGVAHRRPGAAPARQRMRSLARSSSCAAAGSASSPSPTTISIRSRSNDLAHGVAAADKTRLQELKAIREERFELMAQLAQLPRRHGVLHADHDGSGRGRRVPRGDARARTSRARWSASRR